MLNKRLLLGTGLIVAVYLLLSLLPQVYQFENTIIPAQQKVRGIEQVEDKIVPIQNQVLGLEQLHSPQMDSQHIELSKKAEFFTIKDITSTRKTNVYFEDQLVNASAAVVDSVTHVLINNTKLTLTPENEQLTIFIDESKQSYKLNQKGLFGLENDSESALGNCKESALPDFLISFATSIRSMGEPTSLLLGGSLLCNQRLSLKGSTNATIHLLNGKFLLHSATPEAIFIKNDKNKNWQSLSNFTLPSNGKFWAGRTKYQVETNETNDGLLTYKVSAIAQKPFKLASQFSEKDNETWTPIMRQFIDVKNLSNTLAFMAVVLFIALWLWKAIYNRKSYETVNLQWYVVSVIGFTLLFLERLGWVVLPIEWSIYLLITVMVLNINKAWHMVLVFIVLTGVFNQLSLAITAGTENMMGKTHEQVVGITAFCLFVLFFKAFNFNFLPWFRNKWFLGIAGFIFVSGLIAQLVAGSEVGIPGLPNPIETLKMAMAFLAASFMGRLIFFHGSLISQQFWKVAIAGLAFLLVAGVFLASMSDFSPSLILLAMSCAIIAGLSLLFKTRENVEVRKFAIILPATAMVVLLGMGFYINTKLNNITIDTYEMSGLPAVDRWKTLKLPTENYINAYQVNQAKIAQANAGVLPNTHWEKGFAVPAIQDDFAITHLLARQGKIITGLFVFSFIGLTFYFLLFSFHAMYKSIVSKGLLKIREEVVQLAIFSSLMSSALLAHIFVNISSNLGYMPVMGQPLAFVSIANSHLLFFIIPTVTAIGLLQSQIKRVD